MHCRLDTNKCIDDSIRQTAAGGGSNFIVPKTIDSNDSFLQYSRKTTRTLVWNANHTSFFFSSAQASTSFTTPRSLTSVSERSTYL